MFFLRWPLLPIFQCFRDSKFDEIVAQTTGVLLSISTFWGGSASQDSHFILAKKSSKQALGALALICLWIDEDILLSFMPLPPLMRPCCWMASLWWRRVYIGRPCVYNSLLQSYVQVRASSHWMTARPGESWQRFQETERESISEEESLMKSWINE